LWLAGGRQLVRVDPTTQSVTVGENLPVDAGIGQLAGGGSRLLAVGWNKSEIWVLDPETGALTSSVRIPDGELVMSIVHVEADDDDEVWATGNCGHALRVSGMAHPTVHKVQVSDDVHAVDAVAAVGSLWAVDGDGFELVRVDLRTGQVAARLAVDADRDDPAFAVVAGQYSVWLVGDNLANGVMRVDPATNRVLRLAAPTGAALGVSAVVAAPPH
jgi:hypothetical protein